MMKIKDIKKNRGFTLLYAVMISSIILAITLGVMSIALKEINFGGSAKDTNDAFFAADTGAECALYYDKENPADNAFTGTATMNCSGSPITLSGVSPLWSFVVPGLGTNGQNCAKVVVDKSDFPTTVVTSKGYNIGDASCASSSTNRVERELQVTYVSNSSNPVLIASPSAANPGDTVTVTFSGIQEPTARDWIGEYTTSAEDNSPFADGSYPDGYAWVYDNGSPDCSQTIVDGTAFASGSCKFIMPSTPGDYNFRIFENDGLTLITASNTVTVSSSSPPAENNPTLVASPSTVSPGDTVTVTFADIPDPTSTDWIGKYNISTPDSDPPYPDWVFGNGCSQSPADGAISSGSCTFVMPSTPGDYNFRFFPNGQGSESLRSNTVTVSP